MSKSWRSPELKCLTAAVVAVALLAASTNQAVAATSRPETHASMATAPHSVSDAQHAKLNQSPPNGSGKSYFWSYLAITAGVIAGTVALGLWGDLAIGGIILVIEALCAGAAIAARRVGQQASGVSRRQRSVVESKPAASPES